MPTTIRQLWDFLGLLFKTFRDYRKNIAGMFIFSAVTSVLEGIGINSIIPLFASLGGDQAEVDLISRGLKKLFLFANLPYTTVYLLGFIALIFILKAAAYFLGQYWMIHTAANYEKNTRIDLLRAFLQSNWPYLARQKVGNLDQILITDLNQVAGLLAHISFFAFLIFNFLVYNFLVLNISWLVAVMAFLFGITTIFLIRPVFLKTRLAVANTAAQQKELAHYINESLIGMKTIKSYFVETSMLKRGVSYFEDLRKWRLKAELMKSGIDASLQPIGIFFIIAAFLFLRTTEALSLASFAVIVYAVNKIFVNIQNIQSEAHLFNSRTPYLHTVLRYQEEAVSQREEDRGRQPFVFNQELQLKEVVFGYGQEPPVLKDLNLTVSRGEMIGLVGPSGVGKTTLVDLLLRLLKPQSGEILLDNQLIEEIRLSEWRRKVGYVSQDIFLINDTVLNNIRFYDEAISEKQVELAARLSNSYDFIQELPEKFETMVGERGLRLSVGQRQRIALARALVRNPEILILDEATSALDNESEIAIQKAIEGLRGKITVIAIAHRLPTILDFDKVLILDSGKIVEQGKPRELLQAPNSQFYKLYNIRK